MVKHKYVPSWKHDIVNFTKRMKQYAALVKQQEKANG